MVKAQSTGPIYHVSSEKAVKAGEKLKGKIYLDYVQRELESKVTGEYAQIKGITG